MVSTILKSHFVKQTSFSVEYAPAHITKWRSDRTGLQVTYIDQPSPVVNGYFAVATEIPDNSGCPHTLEHLIFMGSKKFPYKGLLDNLGNRFFSSTNAWTSVDQTVYTLTTAGWEGFKTLLPIYLDHLFNPTLTDEACLTEVYHIDGSGKEKGVVFSEMQGIESQSWFISFLKMQQTLYAKDSGYSSETGGLMSELRHLTNDQIKEFHKSMYRPDNLCVVITGSVDESELLHIMEDFDNELSPLPSVPNKRPFVDSKHDFPLTETIINEVEFPDKDESMGELLIAWIGPTADETVVNVALDMVGSFFTDSAISLFNKHLVEIENPMATEIDYSTDDYIRTGLNFTVSGIPTDRLYEVDLKIKELIKTQTDPKTLDLDYLKQILNQQKLKFIFTTEKSPSTFSNIAISEFIYGKTDGSDLSKWSKDLREYEILEGWTADQWCTLIKTYFVDNKSATILGKPSARLNTLQKRENKELLKSIREKYGKDGLKELADNLEKAQEINDTPIPDSILTQFGKPDPSKISFIETNSYKSGSNNIETDYIKEDSFDKLLKKDCPENFPMFFHLEDFKSQFTTINLVMSSTKADPALLRYMSILEEIFSFPIKLPSGEYIPYEEVISKINDDLIEYQLDNGFDSQFLELINVKVKFETKNYNKAIEWLLYVLKYSVIEQSRIKIIIEKIINSLPDKKRNGELMMYSSQYRTLFNDSSLRRAQDCLNTEEFYKDLLQKINDGNFHEIEQDLNNLKNQLFNLNNFKIFVVGNSSSLSTPISSWTEFANDFKDNNKYVLEPFEKMPRSFQFKSDIGVKCSEDAFIVTTPATESTHLISSTPIPTDYLDKDIFKIALASEFLTAVEGPFWRGIRGVGLAYGASIRRNIETGYLNFSIYRGADAEQAWLTGKKIVDDYSNGTLKFDTVSIENAVAAIVNELANGESNNYDSANCKISDNLFKGRGPNYGNLFLKKLNMLTADDLVYTTKKYFQPLFDAKHSVLFTCLPPAKAESFQKFLVDQGYKATIEEINADLEHDCKSCNGDEEESDEESDEESEEESDDDVDDMVTDK